MKKIFRGRKYDTDTATRIAEHQHLRLGDIGSYVETLYRKRSGEYFLFRELFGPIEEGVNPCQFTPLKFEEARQWAEENTTAEEYESEFKALEEDEEKTVAVYNIEKRVHAKIKRLAAEQGITASQLLTKIVDAL